MTSNPSNFYVSIFDGCFFFEYLTSIKNDLCQSISEFEKFLVDLKNIVNLENKKYKQNIVMKRLERSVGKSAIYGPIKPYINKKNSTFSLGPKTDDRYMNFAFYKLNKIISSNKLSSFSCIFETLKTAEEKYIKAKEIWYKYLVESNVNENLDSYKKKFEFSAYNYIKEILKLKRFLIDKSQSIVSEAENILRIKYNIFQDIGMLNYEKKTENLILLCDLRFKYHDIFSNATTSTLISSDHLVIELNQFQSSNVFHGYGYIEFETIDSLIYLNINTDRELAIYYTKNSNEVSNFFIEHIVSQSERPDCIEYDFHLVDVNDYSHLEIVPIILTCSNQANELLHVIKHGYSKYSNELGYGPQLSISFDATISANGTPPSRKTSFSIDIEKKKIYRDSIKLKSLHVNENIDNKMIFEKIISKVSKINDENTTIHDIKNNKIFDSLKYKNNHENTVDKNVSTDLEYLQPSQFIKDVSKTKSELFDEIKSEAELKYLKNISMSTSKEPFISATTTYDNDCEQNYSKNYVNKSTDERCSFEKKFNPANLLADMKLVKNASLKKVSFGDESLNKDKLKSETLKTFIEQSSNDISIDFIMNLFEILKSDLRFLKTNIDNTSRDIKLENINTKNISSIKSNEAFLTLFTILTVKTKPILEDFESNIQEIDLIKNYYKHIDSSSFLVISMIFSVLEIYNINLRVVNFSNWKIVYNLSHLLFKKSDQNILSPNNEKFKRRLKIIDKLYEVHKTENFNPRDSQKLIDDEFKEKNLELIGLQNQTNSISNEYNKMSDRPLPKIPESKKCLDTNIQSVNFPEKVVSLLEQSKTNKENSYNEKTQEHFMNILPIIDSKETISIQHNINLNKENFLKIEPLGKEINSEEIDENLTDELNKLCDELEEAANNSKFIDDFEKSCEKSESDKLNEEAENIFSEIISEFSAFTTDSINMMGFENKTRPKAPGKLKKKIKNTDFDVFSYQTDEKLEFNDSKPQDSFEDFSTVSEASADNILKQKETYQRTFDMGQISVLKTKLKTTNKYSSTDNSNTRETNEDQSTTTYFGQKKLKAQSEQNIVDSREKDVSKAVFGTHILKSRAIPETKQMEFHKESSELQEKPFGMHLLKSIKKNELVSSNAEITAEEKYRESMIKNSQIEIQNPHKNLISDNKNSEERKSSSSLKEELSSIFGTKVNKSAQISSNTDHKHVEMLLKKNISIDKPKKIEKSSISLPTLINDVISDINSQKKYIGIEVSPNFSSPSFSQQSEKASGKIRRLDKSSISLPQLKDDSKTDISALKTKTSNNEENCDFSYPSTRNSDDAPHSYFSKILKLDKQSTDMAESTRESISEKRPSISDQGLNYCKVNKNSNSLFLSSPPPSIAELEIPIQLDISKGYSRKSSVQDKGKSSKEEKSNFEKLWGIKKLWKKKE